MEQFSWDFVVDFVENAIAGFSVDVDENEVEFDIPDCSWSFYVDPKEVTTWNDLVNEFEEQYNDFDPEEYVMDWLEAKRNGTGGVPDVFTLVENAKYIDECLDNLVILLVNYKTA